MKLFMRKHNVEIRHKMQVIEIVEVILWLGCDKVTPAQLILTVGLNDKAGTQHLAYHHNMVWLDRIKSLTIFVIHDKGDFGSGWDFSINSIYSCSCIKNIDHALLF